MATPERARPGVVVRLGVTGELGAMSFPAVLRALQGSHELLQRTAHRVLGDRASGIDWRLRGLREGSALTLIEALETDDVTERELREVATTYTRDLAQPVDRLPVDDLPLLRDVLLDLRDHGSGGLLAEVEGDPDGVRAVLEPDATLDQLTIPRPARYQVIGSVTGRLDSINVHDRREASLWNELDRRRVVVSFGEAAYEQVHRALRRRVEVSGLVTEDADGRPLRVRLQRLEIVDDDSLPTLSSLVGSLPELTGGLSAADYLARSRRELGLG